MSTALTKAFRRTQAIANDAFDSTMRAKANGAEGFSLAPGGAAAGLASWQEQQVYADRYNTMREWVYAAINALASEAGGQPVVVARLAGSEVKKLQGRKRLLERLRMSESARRKTAEVEYEIQEDHPFVDLLERPNQFQEKWQFVYSFVANLILTGWAFVVLSQSKRRSGRLELYSLPTTWVKPKHDEGLFQQFEMKNPRSVGVEPAVLERNQVGFAHLPNPADPLSALAPASAQLRTLRIHDHMLAGQEAFFENGVFPSVIVTMAQGRYQNVSGRPVLSGQQRRQIYAALRQNIMGDMKQGAAFIVDGLIDKMEPFSLTNREMGWDRTEDRLKSRILSAFGVHEFILGGVVTVGGYAQAEIIERRFYKRVNTYLDMLGRLLTNLLGSLDGDERMMIWFEECRTVNPERRDSTLLSMRSGGDISQNELRAEMGFSPDEDLNQAVIQSSMMAGLGQVLALLGGGAIQPEQAVATMEGMGIPTEVAEGIAGVGLPGPEPPQPPPQPSGGEEGEPEEEGTSEEALEELKMADLLLAKALEGPERQAERILGSAECRC